LWRFKELQIADSAADLLVLWVTSGLPESSSRVILEGDQRCHATNAAAAQIVLAGPRQREPDALSPMPFVNSEPVHVPSPPVPTGNQGTNNLIAALGDQKGGRGICDQALDIVEMVCRGRVRAPLLRPKL